MRKFKKCIIIILCIIVLGATLGITDVQAASSVQSNLSSVEKTKCGETITVTLKFDNYQNIKKGIKSYQATLNYEKSVFETVTPNNFEGLNNWEEIRYNEENGKFVAIKKAGSTQTEDVMKITLKVKEDAKLGMTTVNVNQIVCSEGKVDIEITESSKDIQIVKDASSEPDQPNPDKPDTDQPGTDQPGTDQPNPDKPGPDQPGTDQPGTNQPGTNQSGTNKPDTQGNGVNSEQKLEGDNLATGKLPKTGVSSIIIYVIIALEIVALISFIKYRKVSKKINQKKLMQIIILFTTFIGVQLAGTTYATVAKILQKGDVNCDGEINRTDIVELEEHLIDIYTLTNEDSLQNAEISGDGKITVTDLCLLVEKVEGKTDYKVDVAQIQVEDGQNEKYYIEQNKPVTIKLTAVVNNDAKIEAITMNGQEYSIKNGTLENKNDEYVIKINSGTQEGIQSYNFTEVLLHTGDKVKIDYNTQICVLKQLPTITNYKVVEDLDGKAYISFDVNDTNNSITSARVAVSKKLEDNTEEEIKTVDVSAGNNQIEVDIEDKNTYKVDITVNYDLAPTQIEGKEENWSGTIVGGEEFKANLDYGLKISNVKTLKDGTETTTFEKGEIIQVAFESTNKSKYAPKTVNINGNTYEVVKSDNKYVANIHDLQEAGEKALEIQSVILENGKEIILEEKQAVAITVKEKEPTVTNFEIAEDVAQNNVNVEFDIEDTAMIESLKIELYDGEKTLIDTKDITEQIKDKEGTITVTDTLKANTTHQYTVKIMAKYKTSKESITLAEKEILAEVFANITEAKVNTNTAKKGETVDVSYKIKTNSKEEITEILVNNQYYNAEKDENDEYKIILPVGNEAKILTIEATEIVLSDKKEVSISNTAEKSLQVDVLKDKPTMQEIKQEDDLTAEKVTTLFKIIDLDNAIVEKDGHLLKVRLIKEGNEQEVIEPSELTIDEEGNGKVVFDNLEENVLYNAEFVATYNITHNEDDALEVTEVIGTEKIEIIRDYKVEINEIKTLNKEKETKYFEKDEKILLDISITTGTEFIPEKAIIQLKDEETMEAILTKKGDTSIYETELAGYGTQGLKELKIETIILNNKKYIDIAENNTVQIEVLKDKPQITNFAYKENDNNVVVNFDVTDNEDTLSKILVLILDEQNNEIKRQEITSDMAGKQEVSFAKTSAEAYSAKIIASYDLDNNALETGKNEQEETIIEDIDLESRNIQMKDIQYVVVYKKQDGTMQEVKELDMKDVKNNKEQYIAKVKMKDLPDFYTTIKNSYTEGKTIKLVLNYEQITQYDGEAKSDELVVDYDGSKWSGSTMRYSLKELADQIEVFSKSEITLYQDYDASGLGENEKSILGNFRGTFNGNGHTIYNLSKPLFDSLESAKVSNLKLEGAVLAGKGEHYCYGVLANDALSATTINNVHVNNTTLVPHSVMKIAGGIVGELRENSTITNCSSTKTNILASPLMSQAVGGVGLQNGVKIGGIVGVANKATIDKCYVEGSIKTNDTKIDGIGGICGYSETGAIIKNCTSEVDIDTTAELDGVDDILGNKSIWNSTLENNTISSREENTNLYIPDEARLKNMDVYDSQKEIAYSNLYKLMPFYDAKYLVIDGNNIANDDMLNTKYIRSVLPYNKDGKLITVLTESTKQSIDHIKVIYTDDTTKDYGVSYKDFYGHIAFYKIEELGIHYNYDKYVINENSKLVEELTQYIKNINYEKELQSMLNVQFGRRIYKDYFNETVKENAREFVLQYLGNVDGCAVTTDNNDIVEQIKNSILNSNEFKQRLVAYNYYLRWYDIEIQGASITDLMLFKKGFYGNNGMSLENLTRELMKGDRRDSGYTKYYYQTSIAPYTKFDNVGSFIDYNIKLLGNYKTTDDWFTETFSGPLMEIPAKDYPDLDYRAWTQLKKQDHYLLPILTLPKNSGYMISLPTQFTVGSQKIYIDDPQDAGQREQLLNKMKEYGETNIGTFYNTAAGFIEPEYMNKYADIHMDKPGIRGSTTEQDGKTNDPFNKNFYEALYEWPTGPMIGVAAFAQEGKVHWVAYSALNSYGTWSHENGHNQAAKIFLKGNGRRPSGDTVTIDEDYTDGNTAQRFGDGDVNFNLTYSYPKGSLISTNYTPERINTSDKIYSYYKEMFKTIDFLDYVEEKAFLQLTPEEQSKVAVQAYYSGADVGWKTLTAEEFETMKLKTKEDVYKNKLTINPGRTPDTNGATKPAYGSYGSEGMYIRRWYQPHNDKGRTYSHGLKYTAWQMLGEAGYDKGYVTYYSGISANDLDAIRKVTNDPTMTWEKYKLGRYDLMQENWNNIQYLNADELVEKYVKALKLDAANNDRNVTNSTNVRRSSYYYLKNITDDFRSDIFSTQSKAIPIKTAEEFAEKMNANPFGYYVLDNDIDLSSIDSSHSIINGNFMGKLDGQGHKLIGNKVPIFNYLKNAYISNLEIENSNMTSSDTNIGSLSKAAQYSDIQNVTVRNINITSTNKEVGGLIGTIADSKLKNVHIIESNISGTDRVGTFAGYVGKTIIEECSSNGTISASGNAVGGFIGEVINQATIQNCYSLGNVTGNNDVGGFVGYINKSSINKCFSTVKASGKNGVSGFIGKAIGDSKLTDNIALGNQKGVYKFDGRTDGEQLAGYNNNYEYEENRGISTLDRTGIDFTDKISIVKNAEITSTGFYTSTLGWNAAIWDLTDVTKGNTPKLRNLDSNETKPIVKTIHITTAEQFKKAITDEPEEKFVLDNDINVSSLTGKNAIVDQEFYGEFDGNDHKITGNTLPLFDKLNGAKIKNIIIENTNIEGNQSSIGSVAKQTVNSTKIANVHIVNATVKGTSQVGTLVGYGIDTQIEGCSVNNVNLTATGNVVGGMAGRLDSSTITNSYAIGTVKGKYDVGGLIGYLSNTNVNSCYTNTVTISTKINGKPTGGGFIGQSTNNSQVKNNIAYGRAVDSYKFDGRTAASQFGNYANNYEYKKPDGASTTERTDGVNLTGRITQTENIAKLDFYTNNLKWDSNIWDCTNATKGGLPNLKNSDPNRITQMVELNSIYTAEDFMNINLNPTESYELKSNIDFSGIKVEGISVIKNVFTGKIEGNGYTISNLNNSALFEDFRGTIQNVNIKDFTNNSTGDKVAAFAIQSYPNRGKMSNIKNVKFENINVSGANYVAIVCAYETQGTKVTYENISIKNSSVTASGTNAGMMIGAECSATIQNCYVQGELTCSMDGCGGIVGTESIGVTLNNVISNVNIKTTNSNITLVGGIVGKSTMGIVANNCIAIGNMTDASGLEPKIAKFAKMDQSTISNLISWVKNNYEYENATGVSYATETLKKDGRLNIATDAQIHSESFYKDTLLFDESIWDFTTITTKGHPELK